MDFQPASYNPTPLPITHSPHGTALAFIRGGSENRCGEGGEIMRKAVIASLAVILVAAVVTGAMAIGPGYGRGMMGMGPGFGAGANLTPEQVQKFEQFQKEVAPLREQMFKLRTEMMTLRSQANPDWKAIADKQKAMVDVRMEIWKKAADAGVGPGQCGCGMNMGARGQGRMMGMGRMAM